jgi:hypothetical protein
VCRSTDSDGDAKAKAKADVNAGEIEKADGKRNGQADLVLVDFAGGTTDNWVDWKVMNSLEGDLMASPKIEKFILDKAKASEGVENGEDTEGKLEGN